ncbi:AmmeMemoRadiSam system protein B [Candidatus Bipolaricaulota bacterium]|nr:AmmeMemoRadiSam system protein B [Candidatus Bipolaricaulota bacterium]
MGSGVRTPLVAGAFYPGDRTGLQAMLDSWQLGPGSRPLKPLSRPCGVMVPHAGYPYSGRVAAEGIRWVGNHGRPSRIVILGADHTGMGAAICTDDHDAWRTPLGDAPIDAGGRRLLADAGVVSDGRAFVREHSIEVILPFLQAVYGAEVPFVPIRVGAASPQIYGRLGEALVEVTGERGVLIVSSDLTHYESEDFAVRVDQAVLEQICALDWQGLNDLASSERVTVCGIPAILTALHWSKAVGIVRGDVLAYATSADVTGDRRAVVGYAAVGLGWSKERHGS